MTKPFKIESNDINRLTDIQLTQLLKELLHAEAYKFGIAQRAVDVALNISVRDGGEDGRISWSGGPEQTNYLPNRLTMFQNKATNNMRPAAYANEIMTAARSDRPSVLKPKVDEVLDQGGAYIVFTTQELNNQQKDKRIAAVREKIREQRKSYADTCKVCIYDATKIAGWVNEFISTIVSVQYWLRMPVAKGLKTFAQWGQHENLSHLPFVSVESRKNIVATLTEKIAEPKSCFRLMGLSGLGKTRTAFQVFKENEAISSLVVYIDANQASEIDALVADWVGLGLKAIVIVDNCEYRLHGSLVREIRREGSQISLLTLDYDLNTVSPPTLCFTLKPMTDQELLLLLKPIYEKKLPDLDRIVSFGQGFPQMAVLLAEARLSEDPRIGELTDDELANKLLWRRGKDENAEKLKILQACSLFDVFGIEQEVESQLEYIANVVGSDINSVYECVQEYSQRGLIDRRGRFGQVIPKPLAMRLAGQWWTNARKQKQLDLVDNIPDEMVESFCHQVEKMDFHKDVKQLTEKLCGPQRPFGQAEVILSIRGSRLFRSFVNVNPESTCKALYGALKSLDNQQLSAINGDTRRNLVEALERLCYHPDLFSEAAWCMLLLASAENESWANNATGMLSQLFRIQLSGTAAEPKLRFALLQQALELSRDDVDMLVLEALGQAIRTHGGSRAVGAEYQGSKAPLEEWRPKIWQEIFDYWQEAFDLLLCLTERGDAQKAKVLSHIGHSIRGFVAHGRIEMLDAAIRKVVSINGRYWPAALGSIKHTFEYDSTGMKPEAVDALNSWLKLLSPDSADLSEKLKILVINPPREHRKGDDGHYIDVAAENARALGTEVSQGIDTLLPHLALLLQGEQKQSNPFGYQLALDLDDAGQLLKRSFEKFLLADPKNPSFILGMYRGIFEKSPPQWQENIEKLLADERLVYLYPDFICTGDIQKSHLEILLGLVRDEDIPPEGVNILSYGSVTDGVAPKAMMKFCLSLAELGDKASWLALNVIYMYCFGNKENTEILGEPLKQLVSSVPLHKDQQGIATDAHHWHDLASKLLKEHDDEFAIVLTNQLIAACRHGLNHNDILDYAKPLLLDLMREYEGVLWPIFGDAIVHAEGIERYWLQQLLDREDRFSNQMPSVLSVVPVESVITWCEEQPKLGPLFVAGCVNILDIVDKNQRPSDLFVALLVRFGDDERVTNALASNMGTRGWSGSLVPHLEADKNALRSLLEHRNGNVKRWIKDYIAYIDRQIKVESIRDEEREIGLF